jgi:adenosine deaminase
MSFRASRAPQDVVDAAMADIDAWLAAPDRPATD